MKDKIIVLGGSGMLGKVLVSRLKKESWLVKTIARKESDIQLDVCKQLARLNEVLEKEEPSVIINCAAMVSLAECEQKPTQAKQVNGLLVGKLVETCQSLGAKLVHISTDHWYVGDGNKLHTEEDPIMLINQYSKTKRLGEQFALQDPSCLIIRTNITGFRGEIQRPTFIEWLVQSLEKNLPITLFNDFYTCTISCRQLSSLIIKALEQNASGLINIASQDCISKLDFGYSLAKEMGVSTNNIQEGSIESIKPRRANSLGLNTEKACKLYNLEMPNKMNVIRDLLDNKTDIESAC